ncbi:TPA: hypothetical protein PBO06_003281 [Escherichia coli]|nr:hypothetical protein [Escherichia coli]EKX1916005.1 hypothetical protein [Escherichia coli]ELC9925525.1 hypothetical protein [Escherichia coli]ELQ8941636.1 hypothetical protein [Escherichia coli]ELQ9019299.1 hypothetical protein [Escherichia coli]ELR9279059.1 hypothetical protein [Escherichia coli]
MTTLTDKELIKEIKERIGSLDVRDNIERRAYEIALASLEAEPVLYMNRFTGKTFSLEGQPGADKEPEIYVPLYAAPPAPVVPDDGREKFEALVRFHAGDKNHETLLLRANEGMNYQDPNVDLAWIFWKSSREHI